MLALLAAKALDAKNNADPINRLFDNVANFMTAPFSFPNVRREAVGAALLATIVRKLLCFLANRLQCSRWGSANRPQGLFCFEWGFFSPGPPNRVWEDPLNPAKLPVLYRARAGCLATRLIPDYALLALKVPESLSALFTMLGRELHAWVSKKMISVGYNFGTVVDCLRLRRVEGIKVVL